MAVQIPECPIHKTPMCLEIDRRIGKVFTCHTNNCQNAIPYLTAVQRKAQKSPQLQLQIDSGMRKQLVLKEKEAAVQHRTVQLFQVSGYEVLETSEHRKKTECEKCHHWFFPHEGRGTSLGVPDLLVRHKTLYPPFLWVGVEMKGHQTPISSAQQILAAKNAIAIAYSDKEAWSAVKYVEMILKPIFDLYTGGFPDPHPLITEDSKQRWK